MSQPDAQQKHWNTIAGIVAVVVLCVAAFLTIAAVAINEVKEEPRQFAIYVKNAGSLGVGDPVYLNGRRVGRVEVVELVKREGNVLARVDFSLYDSVSDLEFPVDSKVIVVGPGLISGPRLVLGYGSTPEVVEAGGEFKDATAAEETDQISSMAESVRHFDKLITELEKTIGDPEFIEGIQGSVSLFRTTMDELVVRMNDLAPSLRSGREALDGTPERLEELRAELGQSTTDIGQQLNDLQQALDDGSSSMDELNERLTRVGVELREYQTLSEEASAMSSDGELKQMLLRARWEAASLAAQLDGARYDPSAAGGDAGAQRIRERFNGRKKALDRFGGDTDINEFD
ncbi:MAG: MCE family protein [Planctomycetes bacterium]|nr:MCE family protein [Planctomycetota bacterium]MCA8934638.1 MCE family protein [Planctomycetota bacterium]